MAIVVNKLTENVVIGQFRQTLRKLLLKFGQVVVQVQVLLVVITVCTQQVDQAETML
tara:strand:- start:456 stop:626 length:171 start_codon:yes stop_codon:yes gene_type:complete